MSPVEPSGVSDRPVTPADRVDPNASDEAGPAKNAASAKKADQSVVLRSGKAPVDQLDFDDRHDTRATESKEMAQRYIELRKDRRKNDWHYMAMELVVFVVKVAVYLAGFVLVLRLFPHLNPWQVAEIVGLACIAGGGGMAVRSARRAFKQRYRRRRGQAPDPT